MYRVTGIYVRTPDVWFDFDYYTKRHMPMVMERFGPGAVRFEVARVLGEEKYVCIGTIYVESPEVFHEAMRKHLPEISADVANYTNIRADIVLEEVL